MEGGRVAADIATPAGERKLVAALFLDLTGYTALAARMDPEEVHAFLAPLMIGLRRIVEGFGGLVLGEMGDGLFAVFGVPSALEDDAERAVRAALAARDHVEALNAERRDGFTLPSVHAGINHGEVFVSGGAAPSVVGDVINVASRLADDAPGGTVLVSDSVRERTRHAIRYGSRRTGRVKGKAAPVARSEVLGTLTPGPSARVSWRPVGFVGRRAVVRRLEHLVRTAASDGRARVAVVAGEAGAGKTRLAIELRGRLGDVTVVSGRCLPYGQRMPLAALAAAVADHVGVPINASRDEIDDAVSRFAHGLVGARAAAGLAAQIHALLGTRGTAPRDPVDAGAAARAVLAALARRGAVAVLLDDLHWADPDLLAFLADMAGVSWEQPVAFLGFSRPDAPATQRCPVVALSALTDPEMRALLRALLGGAVSREIERPLLARASGNPLFLEESVRMLIESDAVRRDGDAWRLVRPKQLDAVPDSIRSLIGARIDALDPASKRVLLAASVCGTATWDALLEQLCGPDAAAGMAVLTARGLLRRNPVSSIQGTTEYGFRHVLVRDAAYSVVPKAQRAAHHVQIASWLERVAGDRQHLAVAGHLEQAWHAGARDPATGARAVAALLGWGDEAHARQARLAASIYDRARAIADEAGDAVDDATRGRLLVAQAETLCELGRPGDALPVAREALRLTERIRGPRARALALLAEGRALSILGDVAAARAPLEGARSIAAARGDVADQVEALARLSETWRFEDYEREVDLLREAYRLAVEGRDRSSRAVLAQHLALLLSPCGGQEFLDRFEEAVKLVADEGDLRSRVGILRAWCYYALNRWRFDDAVSTAHEARPLAAEAGARAIEADALLTEALAMLGMGPPERAAELAAEVIEVARDLGAQGLHALGLLAAARADVRLGEPRRASRRLRHGRRLLIEQHVPVQLVEADLAEAAIALDRGDWRRVAPALEAAAEPIERAGWSLLGAVLPLQRGRAQLLAGDHGTAAATLAAAGTAAKASGADGVGAVARLGREQARVLSGEITRAAAMPRAAPPEAIAVRHETEALLAWRNRDRAGAAAGFARAIEGWRALGLSAWLARALAAHARASGRNAAARRSEAEARAVLERIGTPVRDRDAILSGLGPA